MPISEFHFAFCGIATVAATLSYACARRAAASFAPSKPDVEAASSEERSLKRKLDDSDHHDVDAEAQPRPTKRNRTPPSEEHQPDDDDEWQVIVAPPSYEQVAGLPQLEEPIPDIGTPPQGDLLSVPQNVTPTRESTPPPLPHSSTASQPDERGVEGAPSSTPQPPQDNTSPNEPQTPPRVTSSEPPVPAKSTRTDAFSAFSGSSSPFASYSNTSGASPFALSARSVKTTPAWRRDNKNESDVFSEASSTNVLGPSPNQVSSATTQPPVPYQGEGTPEIFSEAKPFVKASTCLTGEEDESVETELKGVKLFIKRGRNEFTDGMYGHVKILTHKSAPNEASNESLQGTETETSPRTRLLFRRDPLGQVSMNVGLHPAVRCHFDAAENILRVILMEQVTTEGNGSKETVFVYALKPGRAGKADFRTFAKTLCDHRGLECRASAGNAAAS